MKAPLRPPLSDVLALLLPMSEETLLLRACLAPRESARDAWGEWRDQRTRSGKALLENSSVRKLRPLLFNAVQSHNFEIDKEALTYLRTAYLKEELRDAAVRRVCGDILLSLEKERFSPIVLKGIALAETVYGNPVLRHCHDIDILLPDDELSRPVGVLASLGFRSRMDTDPAGRHLRMVQDSGLPLEFHSSLFDTPYYQTSIAEIRARSRTHVIAGVTARILAPEDNLLHVCGHASYSSKRPSLRWVTDAWFIIAGEPRLDWELLEDRIRRSGLTLPLTVMLRYMAGALNAAIPPAFLERLAEAASNSRTIERQLALRGTRSAGGASLSELFASTTHWRERALIVQWLLFPVPQYLSWVDHITSFWLLPLYYIYRPVRFLGCLLRLKMRSLMYRGRLLMRVPEPQSSAQRRET